MQLPIELHFESSPPCACIACQSANMPAAANGIDAHQAEAAGSDPAHKVRLARANNEAIATRVFSAPCGRWRARLGQPALAADRALAGASAVLTPQSRTSWRPP